MRASIPVLLSLVLVACGTEPAPLPAKPIELDAAYVLFSEGDVEACRAMAEALGAADPAPVAWLLECLHDENRHVREWSAHALGEAAPTTKEAVDALIAAFEDEDDWVRWKAARALGNIGPAAAAALPQLEKAAADVREEVVNGAAQKAVRQIRGVPATSAGGRSPGG